MPELEELEELKHGFVTSWENFIYYRKHWNMHVLKLLRIISLGSFYTRFKVFIDYAQARFGAVIIVDFYVDDFIFALFIFMKDGKAVNYNCSEIIG